MRVVMSACVMCLLVATVAVAQDGRTAALKAGGMVALNDGEGKFCDLELNVHGPEWTYSSQADAKATVSVDGEAKVFTGTLPVPDTDDGAVTFREDISADEDGLKVGYELGFSGAMTVNGLQVSLLLPADRFAGTRLTITGEGTAKRYVALPAELDEAGWVLASLKGKTIQIGTEEGSPTVTLDKSRDLLIHDLRRWERDEFEIRIPIIAAEEGTIVGNTDNYDLEVTLAPGPVEVKVP